MQPMHYIAAPPCRSALISLSDLSDEGMRDAKAGAWWETAPWRYMANISAVYESRPSRPEFDAEWGALVASGSGERGLFSRAAAAAQCHANRGRAADGIAFGTNPCSEIILRPGQFCNLSEVWPLALRANHGARVLDPIFSLGARLPVAWLLQPLLL